jgi:hypothetical protein
LAFLLGCLEQVEALETAVGEFPVTSEADLESQIDSKDFNAKLMARLVALDTKGSVGFHYHPGSETNGVIRSSVDAVQACEIHGWETLVYGGLVQRQASLEVEIHIYGHVDRKILKIVLLRSTLEDYDTLITDSAQKIFDYFAKLLVLNKAESHYTAEKNSWVTDQGAFWWGTTSPWNNVLVPIAGYQGTYSVRLGDPLWANGEWAWLQEFGFYGSFSYATNAQGIIPFRLYDGAIGPLYGWDFVWQRQQEFFVTMVPAARFHFLDYQALYEPEQWSASTWYGGIVNLGFRLWIDPRRTFALGLEGGVSAYAVDPFFWEYHLGASLVWKGAFQ